MIWNSFAVTRLPVSSLPTPRSADEILLTLCVCISEFTDHQRNVFCVFSGTGVASLRHHLNTNAAFAHLRDASTIPGQHRGPVFDASTVTPVGHGHGHDTAFDEPERDALEDDDVLDDGTEMVVDTTPPAQNNGASLDAIIIPPPPPPPPALSQNPNVAYQWNPQSQPWYPGSQPHSAPASNGFTFPSQGTYLPHLGSQASPHLTEDAMDVTPLQTFASTASTGAVHHGSGPSTASLTATYSANSTSGRTPSTLAPSNVEDSSSSYEAP